MCHRLTPALGLLTAAFGNECSCHPHAVEEETKAREAKKLAPKIT